MSMLSPALYDAAYEHDSCGFGLIAQIDGQPSRWLVETGLSSLARMSHRGAVAADGASGDGAGLLIQKPEAYLRAVAAESKIKLGEQFTAGNIFIPADEALAKRCRQALADGLAKQKIELLGWRELPIDRDACGEIAAARLPRMEQVFVAPSAPLDDIAFGRALFLARRYAEQNLRDVKGFYIVTLSPNTIGFKAMVTPDRLPRLFLDLARDDMQSCAVVFHQRFSTNTMPDWPLAQPFRMLAHNGEINTIAGNRAWAKARSAIWRSADIDFSQFEPLVSMTGSDSQSLDDMLEVMLAGGMDALQALRILIPPAAHTLEALDPDLSSFYEFYALHSEPWDGPAGIVFNDGRYAGCVLDRNGLRPARWMLTSDRVLTIASEAGVWDCPIERIAAKGRLGPGEMIAVDLKQRTMLNSHAIDRINANRAPFKQWLKAGVRYVHQELIDPALAAQPFDSETLSEFQRRFQLTREERDQVLRVMADTEAEAVGSMGDDTPMAVLSGHVRSLYDSFRQAFAQVTNPPIDPLREQVVMSLATQIGNEGNIFDLNPHNAQQIILNSPILSQRKLREILAMDEFKNTNTLIHLYHMPDESLNDAIDRICREAEAAVRNGAVIVLLSDRYPSNDVLAVHALLATGAVHNHLVNTGLRCNCNLLVETGTARDPHHFACLIGYGATAVYPYLAYQTLFDLGRQGLLQGGHDGEPSEIGRRYRRGIKKGLLKIISKMGISTIASYRGAQLFEIVGLDKTVVERCFPGTPSRVSGAGFDELQEDAQLLAARAQEHYSPLEMGGLLKFVHGGEYHMYNPDVVVSLQRAVLTGEWEDYKIYADHVDNRPSSALRDLLALKSERKPIPIDQVESIEKILPRFDSAGMSLGALSPEAHEALAIAMNRLGCRSNSGEGGEDPLRYGTEKRSKIKQVASGRFGVTPEYLINAEVLQIKIAQGAKPGEGGQLPGHKVNDLIARLRYAKPGIGLISPPPHHDIYSIEDLAELIYDLKQVNPDALVSVKLVAHAGVGTIAAGVAKAYADLITISGHDGGTGASPVSSIRYAGSPWELGLAEAQQTLRLNGLREKIRLQTDGGLKTGLDVIKAAALGAESFGFGTAPMIALGCKYLRICHLNNCATGVATQDKRLREKHFTGLPEKAMNFFRFIAQDVRQHLAAMGLRSLDELIGHPEFLTPAQGTTARQRKLDLTPLISQTGLADESPRSCLTPRNPPREPGVLAAKLDIELREAIAGKRGGSFSYPIDNRERAIGARLSGAIARRHGNLGMSDAPITLRLAGSAGQSLGVWNAGGLHIHLDGEANDGVGKGMAGGRIVVRPPRGARFVAKDTPIIGNACLYGATGGELFAEGRAGERFAVRNSGATAVIEGAGDHCCEYMTGGIVVVLGNTGLNFGAGFTGGFAYVLDQDRGFVDRYNHELIDIQRINNEGMENYSQHLRSLIERHVDVTESTWGQELLDNFRDYLPKFWLVKPRAASVESLIDTLKRAA